MMDTSFEGLRLIAGEPALDFLNSVKFRGQSEPGERIRSFSSLCRWCQTAGLLTMQEFRRVGDADDDRTLKRALKLRETFRTFLGDPQNVRNCEALTKALSPTPAKLRVCPDLGRVIYQVEISEPRDVLRRLQHEAAMFLKRWDPDRTRSCQADDCDWVFLDQTKAGRRRWCDSSTCGNRDRVRKHRHKAHSKIDSV